ncbi:MAG: class I SAM-dependent methyltransferase [Anaerolineae bacterium]|nr:class I SAM-dependent methyltransferase [Anaerolineae bacterium]
MKPVSLFEQGNYSLAWVRDFYTQAGIWWGPNVQDEEDPDAHVKRAGTVECLCGVGTKRILELGAGSGRTAAAMADLGHTVVAVELNPTDVRYARDLLKVPRKGSLTVLEGDYYDVALDGGFDVVCWWQGFGLGSDADQRRMLRRIACEWLAPGGSALIDVYNPTGPIRHAGSEVRLSPLPGVPGSVEMFERCHFDPVRCRWIDEWQPVANPDKALAQTIRCYTPADLLLLLEGTGLALKRIEVDGQQVDFKINRITTSGPLMEAYLYFVQLVAAGG